MFKHGICLDVFQGVVFFYFNLRLVQTEKSSFLFLLI